MRRAILFDLGNTLAAYWPRAEFPIILRAAILAARSCLDEEGLPTIPAEVMWQRVQEEDHSAPDHRVRPLEERLVRIFGLDVRSSGDLMDRMCRRFMEPIFRRGRCYPDAWSTLEKLRVLGIKTAIISNSPWGSPAKLWREEIKRLGLASRVDAVVFCGDVGWRKPAPQIFRFALDRLGVRPAESLFVGDDPRWDLAGPRAVGIDAILIDREGALSCPDERPIRELGELWQVLDGSGTIS
jgi:putative hydrolase of the HAD superfamily